MDGCVLTVSFGAEIGVCYGLDNVKMGLSCGNPEKGFESTGNEKAFDSSLAHLTKHT